jgi:aldose 1-epimerase
MKSIACLLLLPLMNLAADYSIEKKTVDATEVYILRDTPHGAEVTVAPSFGNNAYDMQVRGKPVLWSPVKTLGELIAKPSFAGIPLLWPWANRLDGDAYFVNGKKYILNSDLGNIRRGNAGKPIHGMLSYAKEWKVVKSQADAKGAALTSRLEFASYPGYMAQFPFAHTIEMTYRLAEGALEVETVIVNHSVEPMPVSLGYHPYFQVTDAPRDEWRVHLAAKDHVKLSKDLIPTGEIEPIAYADPQGLRGVSLDDVFTGLIRDANGQSVFTVEGKKQKIAVEYGPNFRVAVVYSPVGRDFICFEPMTAVTNAINAAHEGWYKDLQWIPAGGTWRDSFRIRPSGF